MSISQSFVDELALVLSKHAVGADCRTPDFILATFVANVLKAYVAAMDQRHRTWFDDNVIATPLIEPANLQDPEYLGVRQFHVKFNQVVSDDPQFISQRLAKERFDFMLEELTEWWEKGVLQHDLNEIADGLVDLVYVAKGTAVMYGLPWRALWDDVQRANLAKVPKVTHRGTNHDVGKPEGWVGPQTAEVLANAGFFEHHCWRDADYDDSGVTPYYGPLAAQAGMKLNASQSGELFPENPVGGVER